MKNFNDIIGNRTLDLLWLPVVLTFMWRVWGEVENTLSRDLCFCFSRLWFVSGGGHVDSVYFDLNASIF